MAFLRARSAFFEKAPLFILLRGDMYNRAAAARRNYANGDASGNTRDYIFPRADSRDLRIYRACNTDARRRKRREKEKDDDDARARARITLLGYFTSAELYFLRRYTLGVSRSEISRDTSGNVRSEQTLEMLCQLRIVKVNVFRASSERIS